MVVHNIFVLGMSDVHRQELETITDRAGEEYVFHSLLSTDKLVWDPDVDFGRLLDEAGAELERFDGSVDGVITHWDFPTSVIGPILAQRYGLSAPSLKSLFTCEHKYWSRLEQQASIPEAVPGFSYFDPFSDDPMAEVDLSFPFWVKPVKSHSSKLGFEIHNREEFDQAMEETREDVDQLGLAFNEALKLVEAPPEIAGVGGMKCLAEEIVTGTQIAVEGAMYRGSYYPHGIIDMHKDDAGTSFDRLDYPASNIPSHVLEQVNDLTERYLSHIGFDNSGFNAEYMWDTETDRMRLIEVNTRISQAHSDLFTKVDGVSNHKVVLDVAVGREPSMPRGDGEFNVAAQCMVFHDEDGVVSRVPDEDDMERIRERFPGTIVTLHVQPGDRLSELPRQDSYRYVLAKLYVGAEDTEELTRKHRQIAEELPFEFTALEGVRRPRSWSADAFVHAPVSYGGRRSVGGLLNTGKQNSGLHDGL